MSFAIGPPEKILVTLQLALLLRDGFAGSDDLLGDVAVSCGAIEGQRKNSSGVFLFFNLKPGALLFEISCASSTPYYLATQIPINVPMPSPVWPAFPDRTIADPTLPLGDPGQTAAYKAQLQQATLLPSVAYPFPGGSTLIRGTVTHGGQPLSAATVQQVGGTGTAYTTGADGQFVLFITNPPTLPQQVTVSVTHADLADGNASVTVLRGLTVSTTIAM